MNQHLETLYTSIQQSSHLTEEEKVSLLKTVKTVEKELEIALFKLDRTEKVKRTTAILLEETIEELEQKRKAIEETNAALTKSLDELKAAQAQLIQSEKMASLGELTAGIAHEIQNPLNFVNNFSEVSQELLQEMIEELAIGHKQQAIDIANDVRQNLEKVLHHGKRADGIVKGMLLHSRTSTGVKEFTDINTLVDEYLRLAYHGLRAKDKTFNATLKTDFDESIGKINIVPQDIGRAILNLITNAFYAVSTFAPTSPKGGLPYVPTVTISTRLMKSPLGDLGAKRDISYLGAKRDIRDLGAKRDIGDLGAKRTNGDLGAKPIPGNSGAAMVEISVHDNGPGIPPHILDKIFQPFFTTKPTGQGTGLGLSLSYDIVKAHGGELKVKTKEGEGTEFIISLPMME